MRALSPEHFDRRKCNLRNAAKAFRLVLVGFAVWASLAAAVSQEVTGEQPDNKAVFVSYNVRNYSVNPPVTARAAVKSEEEREATAEILASLNPAMIGLLEVACEDSLRDLQARLAKRGVDLIHSYLLQGADANRRIAFLSAFPIVENHSREHVPFELAGTPQNMQRGLLDVTVLLPNGMPLRLIGLHLKSKREVPDFNQESLRGREAREVRNHLDEIFQQKPGIPLLVWGDFNMLKNEPAWRVIVGSSGSTGALLPIDAKDAHGLNWTHHWAAADLYSRIDFLLATPSAAGLIEQGSAVVVDHNLAKIASDHRPLAITFTWQ